MTQRLISLALTVDGCPYVAATIGAPTSITSSDSDWPTGAVVLPGSIARESLEALAWSEEIKPTGEPLSVSGLTIALDDVIPASGPAVGQRVWTYLFSRRTRAIRSATIASPGISSTDTSIVVTNNPGFSTGAQTIWIDREAIRCSSFNAGTKTFAVTARGYLGTRAAAHYTDDVNTFAPLVWDEFPNPQRRRAILWMIEGGVAVPLWRGYVGRAPRLDSKGARWELQLDHAWQVQQGRPLGPSRTSARVIGFQPNSFRVRLQHRGGGGSVLDTMEVQQLPVSGAWPETLAGVGRLLADRLNDMLALPVSPMAGTVRATTSSDTLRFETAVNADHELIVGPRAPAPVVMIPPLALPSTEYYALGREISAGSYQAIASLQYPARTHVVLVQGEIVEVPLDSVSGLPTSGLFDVATDGAQTTLVQWALQTRDVPAEQSFHLALKSVDPTTRRVQAVCARGFVGYARSNVAVTGNFLLTQPVDLELVTRVDSSHWLYAVRRGALSLLYGLDDQADPRDWSWSTADRVVGATGGEYTTARMWVFDGSTTLGEFVRDAVRLDACAVSLRGSRITFDVLDPPLASESAAYSIDLTAGEGIHQSVSGYSSQPEGVVNVARIKRENAPSLTVNNQTSIALYGMSKPLEIEAKGAIAETIGDRTPFELARGPLSRALGLWGEPTELVSIDAPITAITSAELCSIVDVTSKVLPSGSGTRGVSTTRRGRVISRSIDFRRGVVRLGVLVYPYNVSGYAPCFRVASFGGTSNKTVTLSTAFTAGATAGDYAASNRSDYTGTANDAGVSAIAAGMTLRFRVVDTTIATEEGGWVVASTNPGAKTITLTFDPSGGAFDWVALLAGGSTLELLFDDYDAGVTAAQKTYAYVGKRSTLTLDGDRLKEWTP